MLVSIKKNVIYIIKQEGMYQSKVNSSRLSTYNCKMGYCLFLCSGNKGMSSFADILQITDVAHRVIFSLFLQSF